jgi:hypothetical protein
MENTCAVNRKMPLIIFTLFILCVGLFYNTTASSQTSLLAGTQLAYHGGGHFGGYNGYHGGYRGYNGYRGYHNGYYNNRNYLGGYNNQPAYYVNPGVTYGTYWTNWYYVGHGCKKTCLKNRNGSVIRCQKRCR